MINQEKLPADSQVGLLGYSGGASATVWAENLYAQGYAKELNVVGGAHGKFSTKKAVAPIHDWALDVYDDVPSILTFVLTKHAISYFSL